jgi:transcriptional regulator with XRE-family HTH domain
MLRMRAGWFFHGIASVREIRQTLRTSAAIRNFEAGNNAPTLGTLVQLAEALGCNLTDLVVLDSKIRREQNPKYGSCARKVPQSPLFPAISVYRSEAGRFTMS